MFDRLTALPLPLGLAWVCACKVTILDPQWLNQGWSGE